jgi:cell division GTPase FtsZ
MKPLDRSLDIVAIGLGQAGGNLAAEFARRGYRAVALNTARTDLSALVVQHAAFAEMLCSYIGIDGYDGAGSNLDYGRDCVMVNAGRIRQLVAEHAKGADIVVLTAGLGGGTGSALSELARVLTSLELPMLTLATLPGPEESAIAKVNAARAVNALVKVPGLTLIWVDNSRLAEQHADAALDEYFQRINATIIEPLDAWNRLNQRRGLRPIRSLDGENLRTLLMSEGVLSYAERQCSRLSVDAVVEWVVSALPSRGVVPTGSVMSDIKHLGFVVEASGDWLASTPFTALEALSERLKTSTSNAAMYLGVYRNDQSPSNQATLRLLASSSSLPKAIQDIVQAARREGGLLSQKLRRSVDDLELGDISDFNLLPPRSATARAAGAARHRRPTHAPAQPLAEAVGPVARRVRLQ